MTVQCKRTSAVTPVLSEQFKQQLQFFRAFARYGGASELNLSGLGLALTLAGEFKRSLRCAETESGGPTSTVDFQVLGAMGLHGRKSDRSVLPLGSRTTFARAGSTAVSRCYFD